MNEGDTWTSVQENELSNFPVADDFNLNDVTALDGLYLKLNQIVNF